MIGGVFSKPLPRLKGQIEAGEKGVSFLQDLDDPQALQVVLKAPGLCHQGMEGVLPCMSEGGMPQIMGQGDRLGELFVEPQLAGDAAGDLRHLKGMGKAGTVVITLVVDEDLGLVFQPPERGAVDDAITIPLEGRTIVLELLLIPPPLRMNATGGIRSEIGALIVDHLPHLVGIL